MKIPKSGGHGGGRRAARYHPSQPEVLVRPSSGTNLHLHHQVTPFMSDDATGACLCRIVGATAIVQEQLRTRATAQVWLPLFEDDNSITSTIGHVRQEYSAGMWRR